MSWSGCWREESICSATDPPLRRDITTCICAMRVPSLHSKQQRKCFPKVQLKCITLSWPHKSALLKHQLCQLATSWSHFGAIPTIHPWAVPLTLDPSYPHTHTHTPDRDPRAVKATGWRRQHAVLHRLSLFSGNSRANGSSNLLRETPKREEPPNLPQLPLFTQNPRPMCRLCSHPWPLWRMQPLD